MRSLLFPNPNNPSALEHVLAIGLGMVLVGEDGEVVP